MPPKQNKYTIQQNYISDIIEIPEVNPPALYHDELKNSVARLLR